MTQAQSLETYAYVPQNPGDNVYEDMGIAVVLMTGPADVASICDATIRAVITKDLIANERVLRNLIVTAGEAVFDDLDAVSEAPYSKDLYKALSNISAAESVNVTWSVLEDVDDLSKMKITRVTKIKYEYIHLSGMGHSMM